MIAGSHEKDAEPATRTLAPPLELWGGPECALCRIGDDWRDQLAETGHRDRFEDLDRIADLGIRAVRYPLLWEQAAASVDGEFDFSWADRRLERLRELGIEVIAGLVHHGSGPAGTDLLDPQFPRHLARFAAAAAERYPWIEAWCPINEPLTTARFAMLYGHWHPHRRDIRDFAQATAHQAFAIAAAMRAIRETVPGARLVQTEDIARTWSTPQLVHQAEYENRRRWLSLDLLFGRVDRDHGWYPHLVGAGVSPAELETLLAADGRPDIIGADYYLTSERFLDHRVELYPSLEAGGNGHDRYVDAEAVRIPALAGEVGLKGRLHELWERYRTPIAITEAHHGCTRDEQLRWLAEVRDTAIEAQREGIDLRALTLWALFGAVDWRSLLTRREGAYEVGAFDVRSEPPRPTVIAAAAKAYARGETFDHPVLGTRGWWARPQRFYEARDSEAGEATGEKLLIVGADSPLGKAFADSCAHRGLAYHAARGHEIDLASGASVRRALDAHLPWAIIAAGEPSPTLAKAAKTKGIPLVGFSNEQVFGDADGPHGEFDKTQDSGSREDWLGAGERNLLVRFGEPFGPWEVDGFAWSVLDRLSQGCAVDANDLVIVSPTHVPDLCHAVLDLLIDGECGAWHLANPGGVTRAEFARCLAAAAGLGQPQASPANAPRHNHALVSQRGDLLPPLDKAIDEFVRGWIEARDERLALSA